MLARSARRTSTSPATVCSRLRVGPAGPAATRIREQRPGARRARRTLAARSRESRTGNSANRSRPARRAPERLASMTGRSGAITSCPGRPARTISRQRVAVTETARSKCAVARGPSPCTLPSTSRCASPSSRRQSVRISVPARAVLRQWMRRGSSPSRNSCTPWNWSSPRVYWVRAASTVFAPGTVKTRFNVVVLLPVEFDVGPNV